MTPIGGRNFCKLIRGLPRCPVNCVDSRPRKDNWNSAVGNKFMALFVRARLPEPFSLLPTFSRQPAVSHPPIVPTQGSSHLHRRSLCTTRFLLPIGLPAQPVLAFHSGMSRQI